MKCRLRLDLAACLAAAWMPVHAAPVLKPGSAPLAFAGDTFKDDPSARTWLPVKGLTDQAAPSTLANLLQPLAGSFRPMVCWYSGSSLQAGRTLPDGKLGLPGSKWDVTTDVRPVSGNDDARDITLTFTLREGRAPAAGVAAAFDFSHWSTDNYTLIPAAVYNGNRLRTSGRGYNTGQAPGDLYRKDLPLTQSDVPRLEIDSVKPSKLEVNSSNVTTPAICFFDPRAKRGFILLAEQGGRNAAADFIRKPNGEILDNAFAIEESADRSRATLVVSAPGVRERKPEFLGFSASPDRGIAMKAGDVVKLKLRVHSFSTPDIPGLLDRFMAVRKDLTGPNHPRKLIPASQVETWMTERIDSILMAREIPGIYLLTDIDRFDVFDAVEARVVNREGKSVTLEIKNPTPHDARVSIFAENAAQAGKPLGDTAFIKWPKTDVGAGQTKTVTVSPNGSLN